jgi:peroxiredoxin
MEASVSVRFLFRATIALGVTGLCCDCSLPSPAPVVGDEAPDLEAFTLAGDAVAWGVFRGDPVLLNLWATWCAPCREETPYLQTLHERYAEQGLIVVGVSQDARGSGSAIRSFIEEFGITYTVLADPEMVAAARYGVVGLPATFLVDREGTIRQVVMGAVTPGSQTFESTLRSILR